MFIRKFNRIPLTPALCRKYLTHLERENTVMHVMTVESRNKSFVRSNIGNIIKMDPEEWKHISNQDKCSPFRHLKYDIGKHGKILYFEKRRNIIRAGKKTHCDAFLSILHFKKWQRNKHWFAALATPNTVLSGIVKNGIPASIKKHHFATYTDKFPGIAIKLDANSTCTPELYPRSGKFIMPGTTTAPQLAKNITALIELLNRYADV